MSETKHFFLYQVAGRPEVRVACLHFRQAPYREENLIGFTDGTEDAMMTLFGAEFRDDLEGQALLIPEGRCDPTSLVRELIDVLERRCTARVFKALDPGMEMPRRRHSHGAAMSAGPFAGVMMDLARAQLKLARYMWLAGDDGFVEDDLLSGSDQRLIEGAVEDVLGALKFMAHGLGGKAKQHPSIPNFEIEMLIHRLDFFRAILRASSPKAESK